MANLLRLDDIVDCGELADYVLDALVRAGYGIIKVGEVPPWMELVSTQFPVGPVYRVTQAVPVAEP